MIDDPEMPKAGKHRELEPAQIKKSEEAVQRVITAIKGFTNPWRIPDKSRLYSLASGAPIDPEVRLTCCGQRLQEGCQGAVHPRALCFQEEGVLGPPQET